jgi:N6-adenosine-specific RNA methylase IME4
VTRFRTLLADPPWAYGDQLTAMKKAGKGASSHYPCMPLDAIAAILQQPLDLLMGPAIADHIANDAHLWLWITNGFLVNEPWPSIVKTWGFTPKTICTWVKGRLERNPHELTARLVQHIGQGRYLRNSTEHLIFCIRGTCPPLDRSIPTAFIAPRSRHSEKPDESYRIIEAVSPGPRLELFARRRRDGWTSWGNEVADAA